LLRVTKFERTFWKGAKFAGSFGQPMTKMLSASRGLRPPDQGLFPLTTLGDLPPDFRYRLVLRTRHGAPQPLTPSAAYGWTVCCFMQKLSPSKLMLLVSNCFVILMIPGRVACDSKYENVLIVITVLLTCPYFLFFCRYLYKLYMLLIIARWLLIYYYDSGFPV